MKKYYFKIKDNIDLHVLSKYGFDLTSSSTVHPTAFDFTGPEAENQILYWDNNYGKIFYDSDPLDGVCISDNSREIEFGYDDEINYKLLYEMTKDGIIEMKERE